MICIIDENNIIVNITTQEFPLEFNEVIYHPWNIIGDKYTQEQPLAYAKEEALAKVNKLTETSIINGFISTCFNGLPVKYDTDRDTQLTMTKARANCEGQRFMEAFPDGMGVRGYNQVDINEDGTPVFDTIKTVYNFLPEHIIAWDEDFSLFLAECKYKGWIKQAQVEAATTKEELDAIILN